MDKKFSRSTVKECYIVGGVRYENLFWKCKFCALICNWVFSLRICGLCNFLGVKLGLTIQHTLKDWDNLKYN